jgi:hypothetical protein
MYSTIARVIPYVKDNGTREQILNIWQLIEKHRQFGTPLVLCFSDYTKAFDCVIWEKLWLTLGEK